MFATGKSTKSEAGKSTASETEDGKESTPKSAPGGKQADEAASRSGSGAGRSTGNTLVAVRGLSLAVNRGESFGLLGPNGAGKSTTIGMLIRYTLPTSGDAEINSHSVSNSDQKPSVLKPIAHIVGLVKINPHRCTHKLRKII